MCHGAEVNMIELDMIRILPYILMFFGVFPLMDIKFLKYNNKITMYLMGVLFGLGVMWAIWTFPI
jgi:hypothetical protein